MRDSSSKQGNLGCDPQEALKPLTKYKVTLELRSNKIVVSVNGNQVCSAAREDRAAHKGALVYAADPCVRGVIGSRGRA